jgi:hypothetical protein
MRLTVSNGHVAIATLLHMPDHLLHDHQVTEMRVAAWHEPGEDVKGRAVADRSGDRAVVPVPDDYTSPHKIRDVGEIGDYRGNGLDAKIGE